MVMRTTRRKQERLEPWDCRARKHWSKERTANSYEVKERPSYSFPPSKPARAIFSSVRDNECNRRSPWTKRGEMTEKLGVFVRRSGCFPPQVRTTSRCFALQRGRKFRGSEWMGPWVRGSKIRGWAEMVYKWVLRDACREREDVSAG